MPGKLRCINCREFGKPEHWTWVESLQNLWPDPKFLTLDAIKTYKAHLTQDILGEAIERSVELLTDARVFY